MITITSFDKGHGPAPDAHIVVDVSTLFRDPHVDPRMRQMTGLDAEVIDSVMSQPGARNFVADLALALDTIESVVDHATLAIGCVGGRHRSVVLAALHAEDLTAGEPAAWRVTGVPDGIDPDDIGALYRMHDGQWQMYVEDEDVPADSDWYESTWSGRDAMLSLGYQFARVEKEANHV